MTDNGTLILRRDSLPAPRPDDTLRMPRLPALAGTRSRDGAPSLAPFALDVRDEEDLFPPARNSDALGLRSTREVEIGSLSRSSLRAGLSAGLSTLAVAVTFAFVAFTSDSLSSPAPLRSPRISVHGHSSMTVATADLALLRAPAKKVKRARPAAVAEAGALPKDAAASVDEETALPFAPEPAPVVKRQASDAAGAARDVAMPAPPVSE